MKQTFTLVELIVTVTILAVGIVFVYEGFFISLGAYSYTQNYFDVQMWMNEKLWQAQDAAARYKSVYAQERKGTFTVRDKQYVWDSTYSLVGSGVSYQVYEAILRVHWRQGQRQIKVERTTYIDFKKE